MFPYGHCTKKRKRDQDRCSHAIDILLNSQFFFSVLSKLTSFLTLVLIKTKQKKI
jgi:hypothetical protein